MLKPINNEIKDHLENLIVADICDLFTEINSYLRSRYVFVAVNAYLKTLTIVRFIQHL